MIRPDDVNYQVNSKYYAQIIMISRLLYIGTTILLYSCYSFADDSFNVDFIKGKYDRATVSKALDEGLNQGAIYAVKINGVYIGNQYFTRTTDGLTFSNEFIEEVSSLLNEDMLVKIKKTMQLTSNAPEYSYNEDSSQSTLDIWFKDEVMRREDEASMPLSETINAMMMNYNLSNSYYYDRTNGESRSTLPFNSRILLGMSDYPVNLDVSSPDATREGISIDNASMSHLLPTIKSEITAGETYSSSRYTGGFSYAGVQLQSVDELLSRRERLYTPVIHGVANSAAVVEVYQDSRLIFTKTVAAGAFTLDEIQGLSNQTLKIVVKESNGSEHTFFYENTVVPGLLTAGTSNYQMNTGRYRYSDSNYGDFFVSGEYSQGLTWMTPTVSILAAEDYHNQTLGVALPLQTLGALGLSASNSLYRKDDVTKDGQSYGISYAKYLTNGMNLQLAGYRFSGHDYYTFSDAMQQKRTRDSQPDSVRNRISATVMAQEPLFNNQLSFSYMRDQYWQNTATRTTYSAGYGGYARWFSYNVSMAKSYTDDRKSETSVAISFDLPFGNSNGKSLYTRYNQNSSDNTTEAGFNSYQEHSSYNVAVAHSSYANDNSLSDSYSMQNDRYTARASSSVSGRSFYASGSLSGTVAYADSHFMASNSQSSTMALAKVEGNSAATINGVRVQQNGFALLPLNDSFEPQAVSVETSSLNNNMLLDQSAIKVRPKRGNVVKVEFSTTSVKYVKATLLDEEKTPVGFGAHVSSNSGEEFYIGNQGGVLMRLALKKVDDLDSIVLTDEQTHCQYKVPMKKLKINFSDDFINVGELSCSRN